MTFEYLAKVKHQGKRENHKIFAEDDEDAQTQAAMKGKVISIRRIAKVNIIDALS